MTRRMTLSVVVALFVGVAIGLAACGSGSDKERTVSPVKGIMSDPGSGSDASTAKSAQVNVPGVEEVASTGAPAALTLDRKIIENTSLDMQVADVPQVFERVKSIADGAGGFVLDASRATGDPPQADVTIRVPSAAAEGVLQQLRGLAVKVVNESSKAQDVTEEYTDIQARLRNSRAVEVQYLDMLSKATTIPDMLSIQDRLTQVRLEIEQLQGRANAIDTLSSLVTVSVHLRTEPVVEQPKKTELDPLAAAGHGWEASLTFLRGAAVVILATAAFIWWMVPVLAVAGIGSLYFVRRGRRTNAGR